MRIIFLITSLVLLIVLGTFDKNSGHTDNFGFRKNIKFNHLSIVIDDSTYKYLFDSLKFLKSFAKISEQTVDAGSESWTGKYIFGINNYLEVFKEGGIKGSKLGNLGLGFTTDKFGTIDSLHKYWTKTLDSVHVDHKVVTDSGKTTPWFTSVSIPNVDSLKISTWVFENSKEEMNYAGFTDKDLTGEIPYSEYAKHITAKMRNVSVDSVMYNKLFDKITSLNVSLSSKELSYLRRSLLDMGFIEKSSSFVKEDFKIIYSISESEHFLLKEINFSLLKEMPKAEYSLRRVDMIMGKNEATLRFKYD